MAAPRSLASTSPVPGVQRTSTLPAGGHETSYQTHSPTNGAGLQQIETLFAHPDARIIIFNAPQNSSNSMKRQSTGGFTITEKNDATNLPWKTSTERLVAAGALSIYRVPGSVAFLSAGTFLKPILAKSQCWCVDGEAKFVLKRGHHDFYRIELPNEGNEDKRLASEFRAALDQILCYEKTPCPFQRGFHVELPESPQITYIPWKPKHHPVTPDRQSSTESSSRTSFHSLRQTSPALHDERRTSSIASEVHSDSDTVDIARKSYEASQRSVKISQYQSIQPRIGKYEVLDKNHERRTLSFDKQSGASHQSLQSQSAVECSFDRISAMAAHYNPRISRERPASGEVASSCYTRCSDPIVDTQNKAVARSDRHRMNDIPIPPSDHCFHETALDDLQQDDTTNWTKNDQVVNADVNLNSASEQMDSQWPDSTASLTDETCESEYALQLRSLNPGHEVSNNRRPSMDEALFTDLGQIFIDKRDTHEKEPAQAMDVTDLYESSVSQRMILKPTSVTSSKTEVLNGPQAGKSVLEDLVDSACRQDLGPSPQFACAPSKIWSRMESLHAQGSSDITNSKSSVIPSDRGNHSDPESTARCAISDTLNQSWNQHLDSKFSQEADTHVASSSMQGLDMQLLQQTKGASKFDVSTPNTPIASLDDIESSFSALDDNRETNKPFEHLAVEPARLSPERLSDMPSTCKNVHERASKQTQASLSSSPSPEGYLWQAGDITVADLIAQEQALQSKSPLSASTGAYLQQNSYEHMGALIGERMASLLLGPPLHLATLMLRIAARFANGARIRDSSGTGWRRRAEDGRKLPGTFKYYSDHESSSDEEH